MFQSVRLSIAVAIIGIAVAVLGQLDHFLPPPPGKLKFAIPSFFFSCLFICLIHYNLNKCPDFCFYFLLYLGRFADRNFDPIKALEDLGSFRPPPKRRNDVNKPALSK